MPTRRTPRRYLTLTPEQHATSDEVRRTIETEEQGEILALAKRLRSAKRRGAATLEQTLQVLKRERQSQGLSLAAMEERTGMTKSNLSKLENATAANPTVATLVTYADALGKNGLRPREENRRELRVELVRREQAGIFCGDGVCICILPYRIPMPLWQPGAGLDFRVSSGFGPKAARRLFPAD